MATRKHRTLSSEQLLSWADSREKAIRLRTSRDIIPGGYLAASIPGFVVWDSVDGGKDFSRVILRNINYGGNPLERTTVLHSVQVNLEKITSVEIILVPSTKGGLKSPSHHMQLRFVFEKGCGPELLTLEDSQNGSLNTIDDLILSWESWRPFDTPYNMIKGLADERYMLTMRIYAGSQRFLEDCLHKKDWYSYRLCLPGGQAGVTELFKVALCLGDGVGRSCLSRILHQGEKEWLRHAPQGDESGDNLQNLQIMQEKLQQREKIEDPLLHIADDEQGYQTLLRSCATLGRYSILTTVKRLVARGLSDGVDLDKLPEPVFEESEPWMKDVAKADLRGIFLRAPLALHYLLTHPELIPSKMPGELARAGLVEQIKGKPLVAHYSLDGFRPYGSSGAVVAKK